MKVFATQEAIFEKFDYCSGHLIAKTSIVPIFKACNKTDKAEKDLRKIQAHFENRPAAHTLELIFDENVNAEFNQVVKVQGPFLEELVELCGNDLKIKVKIQGLRWLNVRSSNSRRRPCKSIGGGLRPFLPSRPNLPQSYKYEAVEAEENDINEDEGDGEGEPSGWQTNDIRVDREASGLRSLKMYFCQGGMSSLPEDWRRQFDEANRQNQFDDVSLCMIRLEISRTSFEPNLKLTKAKVLSINRKILKEELAADVILVAQCGSELKCHKSFLSAHSGKFATMLGPGFKETPAPSYVEMAGMTKEGIQAFLEYIYYWEIGQANNSPRIALELFEAARKYDVKSLAEATKEILMANPNSWYDITAALKLFTFARNVDGCENLKILKKKAVHVLKSKSKELFASEVYHNFFVENLDAAKKLCALIFSDPVSDSPIFDFVSDSVSDSSVSDSD